MGSIIFLPGILGSELFLDGEQVWPPTALEAKFGYGRIDKLTDPGLRPGNPIDSVLCFEIYGPLLRDLGDIASGNAGAPARSFHAFGYDWRVDLRDIAANVAARIDALPAGDLSKISFVGHSMGCLIIRLILESGLYDAKPWFAAVKSFTALAGPHQGAPAALVRALGLEGTAGLSAADLKRVSADPRYPALYQLLPAPGVAALVEAKGNHLTELNLYAEKTAEELGLSWENLGKAAAIHDVLSRNRRPSSVEYVYLAGAGNDTWVRTDRVGAQPIPRKGKETGDGTVPLWSAINSAYIHHAAPAAHDKVFLNEQIRTLLYFSLDARPAATAFLSAAQKPLLSIFPIHPVYARGKPIDIMLVPVRPTRDISGELIVEFSDGDRNPAFQPFIRLPLAYAGAPVEQLKIRLDPPSKIGFYRVSFCGSHDLAATGAAIFVVSDVGGATGE